MPRLTSTLAAACTLVLCNAASAMEQCLSRPGQPPTQPCATVGQVLACLLLPATLAAAIVFVSRRSIRRAWIRHVVVSASVVTCVLWELLALGLLAGVLAPCSSSCWY